MYNRVCFQKCQWIGFRSSCRSMFVMTLELSLKILLFAILIQFYFPGGSDGKASAYNVRDLGSIPGLGRSPGGGNGNPLQYSCLESPMDRGAW